MADPIIETFGLSKTYGALPALSDVTVSIPPGTIVLLGPNGAGKSTFLNCLLNLETPTSGTAQVLGRNIKSSQRESRYRVGVCSEGHR
jgi:ABC-type multidrug transport system ATPase subunit